MYNNMVYEKEDVVEFLIDLFGEAAVDSFEKDSIHVWRDKVLFLMAKKGKGKWTMHFSTALSSYQAAQLSATMAYDMDFEVGLPFLRLPEGTILDGQAAVVYQVTQYAKAAANPGIPSPLPYEVFEFKIENLVMTNRGSRFLN